MPEKTRIKPTTKPSDFASIRLSQRNQTNSTEESEIFSAIRSGNTRKVRKMIRNDPSVLEQKDSTGKTPIFYAIQYRNPKIIRMIIKKNQAVLSQINKDELTPISLATSILYRSEQPKGRKDNDSRILKIILKQQFKEKINEEDQKDLKELFLIRSLLKGIYSKESRGSRLNIFKNTFDLLTPENTLDKTAPENSFDKIYKELFEKVDKNESIDLRNGEKIYAFSSNLKPHQSFFIFHVNEDNKLTSISYCDGNSVGEERRIKGSKTHINGVTTFHLEAPIEYDNDFAKNFIEKNSKNKSPEDFRLKFKNQEIEGVDIDYSKTTHSIPTKIQRRGNCVFKSTSILARFISGKINPDMNFDFDIDTQKPTGIGYDEYKKFKDDLTIKATDFLMNLKEKISSKSGPVSEYLKKEIEDAINISKDHNEKKLKSGLDGLEDAERKLKDIEREELINNYKKIDMIKLYKEYENNKTFLGTRIAHHEKIRDILSEHKPTIEQKSQPNSTFSPLDTLRLQAVTNKSMGG